MALFFQLPIDEQVKILIPILTERYGSLENALKNIEEEKKELDVLKQKIGNNITIIVPLSTELRSGGTLRDLLPPGYQDTGISLSQYSSVVNSLIPVLEEDVAQTTGSSATERQPPVVQNNTGQPTPQQNNNQSNILGTVVTGAATVLIADQIFNDGQITTSIFGGTPSTTVDNTVPESEIDFDTRPQPDPYEVDGAPDPGIENAQFVDSLAPDEVSADDVAAVGQFQAGTADDVPTAFGADPLAPDISPFGEENDFAEAAQVENAAPEPLGPDISPFGEENEFVDEEQVESFDPDAVSPDDVAAVGQFETATPDDIAPVREPEPVGGTFTEVFDEETGTWGVINADTGETVASGLTEQEAILEAENRSAGDPSYGSPAAEPEPDADEGEGGAVGGVIAEAKARQSIREQLGLGANGANRGDWRVRLSLAPGSNYLYNSTDPGILRPLASTQGVIFPYTPTIATTYSANYEQYDLTHSNFRGYFYRNSNVGEITITATFTAQDTREAEYLLAVIHFFRSATKMFYGGGNGQPDEYLGSPPPLVYLTGYGDYQFSGHPCVISQFGYNLPGDVDYIRAFSKNINGTSMASRADQQSVSPTVPSLGSAVLSRLTAIGFGAPGSGGQSSRQPSSPSDFRPGDLGLGGGADNPTYVPTKIDISLTLLPMQSRQRISQEFSLRDFATGKLLRGGMW